MLKTKIKNQKIGKLKVDTFPGRNLSVSLIEKQNHSGSRIFENSHLLAPACKKLTLSPEKNK